MQSLAQASHTAQAEARRRDSALANLRELAATETQRTRLRPQSITVSRKLKYNEIDNPRPPAPLEPRPTKRPRLAPRPNSRLDALSARIAQPRPSRFNVTEWRKYREESIQILQPHYPRSTPSFSRLIASL